MECLKKNKSNNELIDVDTSAGSMAYNRFELQLSETLHMAIELFDSLDYLLVLDYYDDITLFDNEINPQFVSYYQVKSNEESISINTAIKEDWLAKLYAQFQRKEWIIKELGLITNCPLKITETIIDEKGKVKRNTKLIKGPKTSFDKFNEQTIKKVKADIAEKFGISVEEVDLSKFVHMRTTLSITSHRELVEQEMCSFLYNKYSKISVEAVKTIYASMLEILTKRQQYETLPENAEFSLVRQTKGVSKNEFARVIEEAIIISIPTFQEIETIVDFGNDKYIATYEYTRLMADSQKKSESFMNLFRKVKYEVENLEIDDKLSTIDNLKKVSESIYKNEKGLKLVYNETYISILAICILLNMMRKE